MARNREKDGPKYIMVEGTTQNSKAQKIKLSADALKVIKEIRELHYIFTMPSEKGGIFAENHGIRVETLKKNYCF